MRREDLADLAVFLAVAEARSFTRAAAKLGASQSALSQTLRRLETRLGIRLLTRTTRSVAPTQAGERLLASLRPAFDEIDDKLAALTELREQPAGSIRITTSQHAAEAVLLPALTPLLALYPDINLELSVDPQRRDIVAEGFDAGVRHGEAVEKDMIAVRIGPDLRMAVVAAPAYFADHPVPRTPQDLAQHRCINQRFPTLGGVYAWELEREGRVVNARVDGQLVLNDSRLVIQAASLGLGLAFVVEDQATEMLETGRLVRVLEDWCPPYSGYHLYYPSGRQTSNAFRLVVEALRDSARARRSQRG